MADEILEELWKNRETLPREHGHDTGRMFEYLRSIEGRTAEEWLSNEDSQAHDDRLSRLRLISELVSKGQYWAFHGGLLSKYLFEEARYCYVYGQYLATVILGLAYIERTLAAQLYAAGHEIAKNARLADLLDEAQESGLIDTDEFEDMETIRSKRNAYTHFRTPLHGEDIEHRVVVEDDLPYDIIERDAAAVISLALHLVGKATV